MCLVRIIRRRAQFLNSRQFFLEFRNKVWYFWKNLLFQSLGDSSNWSNQENSKFPKIFGIFESWGGGNLFDFLRIWLPFGFILSFAVRKDDRFMKENCLETVEDFLWTIFRNFDILSSLKEKLSVASFDDSLEKCWRCWNSVINRLLRLNRKTSLIAKYRNARVYRRALIKRSFTDWTVTDPIDHLH